MGVGKLDNVIHFKPVTWHRDAAAFIEWDGKVPGSRIEFIRALVQILDAKNLGNIAFAIVRAYERGDECSKELTGLIDLAKQLLQQADDVQIAK